MSDNFANKNPFFTNENDGGRPAAFAFHRVCQMNFAADSSRKSPYAFVCSICGGHQYRRKTVNEDKNNKNDTIEIPRLEELTLNDPTPMSPHPNRASLPRISEDQIFKDELKQPPPVPRKLTRKNMMSAGVNPRCADRRRGGGGGDGNGGGGSGSGFIGSG